MVVSLWGNVGMGLLDFTMLWPVLAWCMFRNLHTVYFFNFPNLFWAVDTESVDMEVCLYLSQDSVW